MALPVAFNTFSLFTLSLRVTQDYKHRRPAVYFGSVQGKRQMWTRDDVRGRLLTRVECGSADR